MLLGILAFVAAITVHFELFGCIHLGMNSELTNAKLQNMRRWEHAGGVF